MSFLHKVLKCVSTVLPKVDVPAGTQVTTLEVGKDFIPKPDKPQEQDKPYGPNYMLNQDLGGFVMIAIVRKPNGDTGYRLRAVKDGTELIVNRKLLELIFVKED